MSVTTPSDLGALLSNLSQSTGNEIIGRSIKVFRFEPHPKRKILIILGEATISIVSLKTGIVETQFTEDFKRPIHLLGLSRSSKSEKIAQDIISNCSIIDIGMLPKLIEAVEEIKHRNYDQNGLVIHEQIAEDGSFLPRYPELFDEFDLAEKMGHDGFTEESADFSKLDDYIEQLYEDIPQKVEASMYLAKLAKCSSYLKSIAEHDSAVNALFRTLREDSKKSQQLTKNILTICLAFAKTKDFQNVLVKHKIQVLTLDIIDFELARCEKWKAQIMTLEESALQKNNLSSRTLNEYRTMWIRLNELSSFQNSLLKVAFEILHYLSEIPIVREILLEHKVTTSIVDSLERRDNELLDILISYLKTLSCYKQFVEQMLAVELVDKLTKILKGGFPIPKKVINQSLHLLYNLTFHTTHRESMMRCGMVTIIANCLSKSQFHEIAFKIFYNLSIDSCNRTKLAKGQIIKTLMTLLTSNGEKSIITTFGCLAVNLSKNTKCAQQIWESNKLSQLIKNAVKNEDCLAMKIIRNMAEHEQETAFVIYECVGDIAAAIVGSCNQEFVIDCIGTLSCIDTTHIDLENITQRGRIFPWVKQELTHYLDQIQITDTENVIPSEMRRSFIDVLLFIGNLCLTEDGSRMVVGEGYAELILKILHAVSASDTTIIHTILYIFTNCTDHESISVYFALKTQIPTGLLEYAESCSEDSCEKTVCMMILEQIARFDDTWKENLLHCNFLSWNKNWVDAVALAEDPTNDGSQDGENSSDNEKKPLDKGTPNRTSNSLVAESGDEDERNQSTSSNASENEYMNNIIGLFQQQFEEDMERKKRRERLNDNIVEYNSDCDLDGEDEDENMWQ